MSPSSSGLSPNPSAVPSLSSSPTSSDPASPTSPTTTAFPTNHDWGSSPPAKAAPVAINDRRLSRSHPDTLRCSTCSSDIAFGAQIISKGFTGRHGRAYLVSSRAATASHLAVTSPHLHDQPHIAGRGGEDLANIRIGRSENRQLVTGAHVVADINCVVCGTRLGWKYVDALEPEQRYKIGKFILEKQRTVACRSWEDIGDEADAAPAENRSSWPDGCGPTYGRSSTGRRSSSLGDDIEELEKAGWNEDDDDDGVVVFDSEDEEECEDIFNGLWDPAVVAQRRKGKIANLRKRGGRRGA